MEGNKPRRPSEAGAKPPNRTVAPAFSSGWWTSFARTHWEHQPLSVPRPFRRPVISEAGIFRATVEASALFCAEEADVPLAFYIEHARQVASIPDFLPVAADKSMARYAERISRKLEGRRFALIVEDIQAYAPELWARSREFLRGLDEAVPTAGANRKATAFIGNYSMTPSGLHVGTSGNFKFVVSGRKRMRLWPDDLFRGRKGVNHTMHIERFLPQATTLEGEAGDVIYWPSDQWHVGEAVGGLCVSISLAVFVKSRAQLRAGSSERNIASQLNRETGGGFQRVPRPLPTRSLADRAVVRGDPLFPIRWRPGNRGEIICSACGHAFAVGGGEKIIEMLQSLNRGQPFRVAELIEGRRSARTLLEKLYALRAISSPRRSLRSGSSVGT